MSRVSGPDADPLRSGEAWIEFCEALKGAGRDILREGAPSGDVDVAEGHRYLTHLLRSALDLIVDGGDGENPRLRVSLGAGIKLGWDNPDNVHHNASLRGDATYRLSGTRGDAHYFSIGVYAGSYAKGGSRPIAFVEVDDLEAGPDGSFEVVLSATEHPGNWIRLEPDTSSMMLRQIFWDRANEEPARLTLERLDAPGPPPPLEPAFMKSALERAIGMMRGTNHVLLDWADRLRQQRNRIVPGDQDANESLQGIPSQTLAGGWWEIAPDEAIVLDFRAPPCRYWSFVLSNYWGQSFDYEHRPIHVNARSARARADGSIRIVVAHRDPALADANWLDSAGHAGGIWQFRWLEADAVEIPEPRVLPWSQLAALA